MSRGHKIIANFLRKRGAWDNNPYKETEMKKETPPFEPDKNPKKIAVAGKAGYGPSAARHLARLGLKQQMLKVNPKLAESWSNAVLDQLAEVHPSIMAMAKVAGKQSLKAKADRHTEMALAANKAGDDAKVKYHQAQVAKIKAQMQEEAELDEANKVYDPLTKKMVARKPIKVQAGGGATRNGVPVETGASNYKSQKKLSMSQAAGMLAAEETELDESRMKDLYTTMMDHATKKGYTSKNQFKRSDYEAIGKEHGVSGADVAMVAHHHTADSYNKLKEDTVNEISARTLTKYADKAHQQALDATYDAAHLNRPGEEKLKANAKRIAAKRAGGVQLAQTKLDRKYNAAGDAYLAHTGQKIGEALELAHSIGDIVTCNSTHRLASVQSVEGDLYTVVYADGSTQTGPADYWTNTRPVNEARVVEQPRTWNVRGLKPAGHGIIGKKVRSYDFPGLHDSHYIEGHVVGEDPHSYHIRTTKVVRYHKEEPIPEHLSQIRAPKGLSVFGGAPGVYHATAETAAPVAAPRRNRTLRGMRN